MIPYIPPDIRREMYLKLAWRSFGGYGLNTTIAEAEQMELQDLFWYLDRVDQLRRQITKK